MSETLHNKKDNGKNKSGPASGRPGAEGSRSDKASRPPVHQQNDQREQPTTPKGRERDGGGRGQHGTGNRIPDQD